MTPVRKRDMIASAGLWAAGLSYHMAVTPLITWTTRVIPAHEVDWLTRIYLRGQLMMTRCNWRAEVDPAVDPDGVYMFTQNHVNIFDYCTMYNATPHYKQGVNLIEHFKIPFYGKFMKFRGTLPVVRGSKKWRQELADRARIEVEEGRSLLVFPEGTRSRDGRVATFHTGMFHIARELQIPIIPTAVTGMWEVLGTGSWIMRPHQDVTVHIMAPIPTAGLKPEDIPELTEHVRGLIAEKVDAYYAAREQGA